MEIMQSMFDGVSRALFLNPSTLSGSIDIIVVRYPDGKLVSTPFHVRFGRLQLLYSAEKIVNITVNGESVPFQMKLGAAGEAFFVHEFSESAEIPDHLSTSPIREAPTPLIHDTDNDKDDGILPSQAEQILQEHPEAVAEIVGAETKATGELMNEKSWDWSWGWGEVPRIQSNEGIDEPTAKLDETGEEAVVTVSEEENTTMTKLFRMFRRGKPEYLPTENETKTNTKKSTPRKGESSDEGGDDIFFDMEEDDDPESTPGKSEDPNQFSTPFESPTRDTDEDNLRLSEGNSEYTIFAPAGASDDANACSPSLRDSELSRSLTGVPNTLMMREANELAQSLPAGKELRKVGVKQSEEIGYNLSFLNSLKKDSFTPHSALEVSLCAKRVFDLSSPIEAHKIFDKHSITHEELSKNPAILSKTDELAVRINHRIFPWKVAFPAFMSALLFDKPLDHETLKKLENAEMAKHANKRAWMSWLYPSRWRSASVELPQVIEAPPEEPEPKSTVSQPKLLHRLQTETPTRSSSTPNLANLAESQKEVQFRKSLRPTTKQIEQMKLNAGANSITFSVNTELRGTQTLAATVYLWEHDAKLVISDIDGTITKSDVFGHVLPMLGKDWSHSGVAKLFSLIRENGYHIVYLTSRAIGQAQTTRNFINNLRQDGDTYLPKGPVFMSPDRLFGAFNREVIRRKPEEFKIACLQDIAKIFPTNPFYAGFGNRVTDLVAYKEAGVPSGRVFIINPSGNITTVNKTYSKTYHNMATLVNEMYPPTHEFTKGVSADYNDWNYWKLPVPDLEELQ